MDRYKLIIHITPRTAPGATVEYEAGSPVDALSRAGSYIAGLIAVRLLERDVQVTVYNVSPHTGMLLPVWYGPAGKMPETARVR